MWLIGSKNYQARPAVAAAEADFDGPGATSDGVAMGWRRDANRTLQSKSAARPQLPVFNSWFQNREGMQVNFDTSGSGTFDSSPIVSPGRTNFPQPGLYRMKLTRIPGHEGVELYPTVEIAGTTPRTHAFLAHNTVPFQLTADDLNQVLAGNFVTKAIYLPDPGFQQLAVAGVETLVSTRLDPGLDPIVEADRRGSILAIMRIGNKDIEMPGLEGETSLGYASIVGDSGQAVTQASHAGPAPELGGSVQQAGYGCSVPGGCTPPPPAYVGDGGIGAYGPSVGIGGSVAGINGAGQYGMPYVGTPIGLPGPCTFRWGPQQDYGST